MVVEGIVSNSLIDGVLWVLNEDVMSQGRNWEVLELSVSVWGLNGDIDRFVVLSEVDADLELVAGVGDVDDVLRVVGESSITDELVQLVGGVGQSLGDLLVLDAQGVLIQRVGSRGHVTAGGQSVVPLFHLLAALLGLWVLVDVLLAGFGLVQLGLDGNLGSGLGVLTPHGFGGDLNGGVFLLGSHEVHLGQLGYLGGGGNSHLEGMRFVSDHLSE